MKLWDLFGRFSPVLVFTQMVSLSYAQESYKNQVPAVPFGMVEDIKLSEPAVTSCQNSEGEDPLPSKDMLPWMNSELRPNQYILAKVEKFSEEGWCQIPFYQAMKTVYDRKYKTVFFRKDDPAHLGPLLPIGGLKSCDPSGTQKVNFETVNLQGDRYKSIDDVSFKGEILPVSGSYIYLRSETLGFFQGPCGRLSDASCRTDKDGDAWDIRIDKFRVFQLNQERFPSKIHWYDEGMIFGPRALCTKAEKTVDLVVDQNADTYYCKNWSEFNYQKCTLYQRGIRNSHYVRILRNQRIDWDSPVPQEWGEKRKLPNFTPINDPFDFIVVIIEVQNGGAGQERYYFGYKDGKYYGFIRHDAYQRNSKGVLVPTTRTIARGVFDVPETLLPAKSSDKSLRSKNDKWLFGGMRERARHETIPFQTSLRITHSEEVSRSCPHTQSAVGGFWLGTEPHTPSHVYDVDRTNTTRPAFVRICSENNQVGLVTQGGCAAPYSVIGSFVAPAAKLLSNFPVPKKSASGSKVNAARDAWVDVCAKDGRDVYLSLNPCEEGFFEAGSFVAYRDCIDGRGERCKPGVNWVRLCTK